MRPHTRKFQHQVQCMNTYSLPSLPQCLTEHESASPISPPDIRRADIFASRPTRHFSTIMRRHFQYLGDISATSLSSTTVFVLNRRLNARHKARSRFTHNCPADIMANFRRFCCESGGVLNGGATDERSVMPTSRDVLIASVFLKQDRMYGVDTRSIDRCRYECENKEFFPVRLFSRQP